jgi:ABC-type amino acid transport substrate-binding protein
VTKTSKITLSVIGVVILAFFGGMLGAKVGGGAADASSSSSASSAPGSFISGIKDRGELRVGVAEAAPLTTIKKDASGLAGGPLTIPMQNLAKQLGVKYVVVPATWDNIVAGLQAGRYDFAAYLDNTLVRATSIQFSNPVLTYQAVFIVTDSSPYKTSAEVFAAKQKICGAKGASESTALGNQGVDMFNLDSYTSAAAAVEAGRCVAAAMDLGSAEGLVQGNPQMKIIVPSPIFYQSGAGFGMPDDADPRSVQLVNFAILDAQDYGELSAAYAKVGYRTVDALGDWQKQ